MPAPGGSKRPLERLRVFDQRRVAPNGNPAALGVPRGLRDRRTLRKCLTHQETMRVLPTLSVGPGSGDPGRPDDSAGLPLLAAGEQLRPNEPARGVFGMVTESSQSASALRVCDLIRPPDAVPATPGHAADAIRHGHASFFPRRRYRRRRRARDRTTIGVPSKLKRARSWLTKYRSRPKWNGPLRLLKKRNVGGATRTCVT